MSGDWRWEDALTDPPVCTCPAVDWEHGHVLPPVGRCGPFPKPPLGGFPIWDAAGRMVGQHPAPPPRTRQETTNA